MTKWNEPPEPVPSWLDPANEVTTATDTKPSSWKSMSLGELRPVFTIACYIALRNLGLAPWQAVEVLGNAVVETGWGQFFRAWNLGGWKIRKTDVDAMRAKGKKALWWRAPGNKAPGATLQDYKGGDPPWCYYRGFESMEAFFAEWIPKFVPKPGASTGRYKKTGEVFWSKGDWFRELCLAGYKGSNTQKAPDGSVASHRQIVTMALRFLCQKALGVTVDGTWGPKSIQACKDAEKAHGLPETGQPSLALLEALPVTS